ncbi:MAG: AAA family ATPase [Dehalococcoidia bacterium]|jgi:dephospho-CoA kinase|nr:AAA family ATPase [Dehalococcoidia bacterium]
MLVVAIVGMAGAGKSEVSCILENKGYTRIRFGDVTDEELKKANLSLNEENERRMRESLRQSYGMEAYAMLNLPKIDSAIKAGSVVVDGIYSWEEYIFLSKYYGHNFRVAAVWSSPNTRYARLVQRHVRPLTKEEAYSRDSAEILKLNKGGPIAMADYTIINEGSLEDLEKESLKAISAFEKQL